MQEPPTGYFHSIEDNKDLSGPSRGIPMLGALGPPYGPWILVMPMAGTLQGPYRGQEFALPNSAIPQSALAGSHTLR